MSYSLAIQSIFGGTLYLIFGAFIFVKLKGRAHRWPYTLWIITSVIWFFVAAGNYLPVGYENALLIAKISYSCIVFIPIMMLHFCSAFLESHTSAWGLRAGYLLAAAFAVSIWIDGVFLSGTQLFSWGYFPHGAWGHLLFVISVAAQTNYFFLRMTRKLKEPSLSRTKREQVLWIRRGLLWYSASSLDFLINWGVPSYPLAPVFSVIGLAHIAYAVVRHQLLDIHVLIRRTLVYSIASTILSTLYVAIMLVTVELFRPWFGGQMWESVIATCLITALCHPLIRRLQGSVDRMLGPAHMDHGVELMKFSSELGRDQSLERTRSLLSRIIDEAFRPAGFVIYRRSAKGYELFVQRHVPSAPATLAADDPWAKRFAPHARAQDISGMMLSSESFSDPAFSVHAAAPLLNQKHLQGFILLGAKRSEDPYTEQDLILLKIVANQAAVALERPLLIKEVGAGFAHEIKTPLANIAMPAELCVLDLQDLLAKQGQDIQEYLPVMVKRMEYIVEQALFASGRVDAMQQLSEATSLVRRATLDLRDSVSGAVHFLSGLAEECGVRVDIQIPAPAAVAGDAQQIEILVTNLIKNAIEAVSHSAERLVSVRARTKGAHVVLEVEDSGPGIAPGIEEHVFEPYVSTKTGQARGMGLYIARRIASVHQSTLIYERRGHRTVMRVTFPVLVVPPVPAGSVDRRERRNFVE